MLEKRDKSAHSSKLLTVGKQEGSSVFVLEEGEVLHKVSNNVDEKPENSLKQEDKCVDNIQKLENNVEQVEKYDEVKLKREGRMKQEGYVDINVSADGSMDDLNGLQCSPKTHLDEDSKPTIEAVSVIPNQKRPWANREDGSEGSDQACNSKRIKEDDGYYGCELRSLPSSFGDNRFSSQIQDVSTSSRIEDTSNEAVDTKSTSERCFFLVDSHAAQSVSSSGDHSSSPWKVPLLGNENRGSPNLELALGVQKNKSRKGVLPFFAGIVDRKGPDRPPDIAASPKEKDEDASASLSLSLAFPFSDKENPTRSEMPLTTLEQALPASGGEANTSLLLFRGSSGK